MAASGPSTVQAARLDTALGTTLGKQTMTLSGNRAIATAGPTTALHPQDNEIRRETESPGRQLAGKTSRDVSAYVDTAPRGASTRNASATVPEPSARSIFSEPAKTILTLLTQAGPARARIVSTQPLWQSTPTSADAAANTTSTTSTSTAPATMARQLATILAHAIVHSGVFYESHLAQVIFGQRTLASLLREPQALLEHAPVATNPERGAQPILPELAQTVRMQLEALAQGVLYWQGYAWPDAPMRWELSEHASHHGSEAPASWSSTLSLHLPRLGTIETRLTLHQDTLVLNLVASDAADELREHLALLRTQLVNAGLTVTDLALASRSRPL